MSAAVAIVTMVYNERAMLPVWLRHYRRQSPDAALFVVDHGSDDGATEGLAGVTVLPLPRTPFDDDARCAFMSDLQAALLRFHGTMVHVDCDEMLVADPRRYPSLAAFLAEVGDAVVAPTGLQVMQIETDAAIDLTRPILGQRRYAQFAAGMCKPCVTRAAARWTPGFHGCDRPAAVRDDLYLFHLATMDRATSLARLRLTRSMDWATSAVERKLARHQLISDEEHLAVMYDMPARARRAAFDFGADLARLRASVGPDDYAPAFFRGTVGAIPEAFFGLI